MSMPDLVISDGSVYPTKDMKREMVEIRMHGEDLEFRVGDRIEYKEIGATIKYIGTTYFGNDPGTVWLGLELDKPGNQFKT
jgi:hypothetical protein